jgi:ABC-type Fe3+/spermidine/putrescine transport system ATPase subunit
MSWSLSVRVEVAGLHASLSGGAVSLIGPNGSGKTTVLRVLAGALRPDSGDVVVGGRPVAGQGVWVPPEDRRVAYVPQGLGLFPHLSVVENIAFGADRERASAMLETLGLRSLAERRPGGLSGGEAQRVALARALVTDPQLLLLDEPLAALDIGARREVRAWLVAQLAGRDVVWVTHDARDVRALGGQAVVLKEGAVAQTGNPSELASDPANPFVAEFFG